MSWVEGVSQCTALAENCHIWWEAWTFLATVFAAFGTWVVGIMVAVIAWLTYKHNRDQAAVAIAIDLRRVTARHESWLTDLRNARFVAALVADYEEKMESLLIAGDFKPLEDFYRVCQDATPKASLRPSGYYFSQDESHKLFLLCLAQERIKSCGDAAIALLVSGKPDVKVVKDHFYIFKKWAEDLHEKAEAFIPAAQCMKPPGWHESLQKFRD